MNSALFKIPGISSTKSEDSGYKKGVIYELCVIKNSRNFFNKIRRFKI
jgi:hypothetical protein